MSRLARAVTCVALSATVAWTTPLTAAELLDQYKAGLAAVDRGEWDRVEEAMLRAIEVQAESKARLKKALYLKHYLPHYYLGLARYEQGNCAGALEAWRESEAQGVIEKFPQFHQELEAGRDACIQHRSEVESSRGQAEGLLAAAGAAGDRARQELAELQATEVDGLESLSERLQLAQSDLDQATRLLAQADGSVEALQGSAAKAAEARDEFDAIRQDSSRWIESLASQHMELRAALNRLLVAAVQTLKNSEYLEPHPSGLDAARDRLEGVMTAVGQLDSSAHTEQIERLSAELEQAISAVERSAAGPPPELTLAAEAFLSGHYEQVLESLAEAGFDSTKGAAQACLLQAAALFSMSRSEGGKQPELLEQARHQVLACQSLGEHAPSLSAELFSPRFIEFFEAQRPWFLRI